MVSYHKGDLLKSGCNIICHQVNLQGVMGGGLAKQIATKHPQVEESYKWLVSQTSNKEDLLGGCHMVRCNDSFTKELEYYVANMFSQNWDFTTNTDALKESIKWLKHLIREECGLYLENHILTIGIPYKYGCGIALGYWKKIEQIWCDAFRKDDKLELQIWELKEK